MKRRFLLVLAFLVLASLGTGCGASKAKTGTDVGSLAPGFALKDLNGKSVNLASLRGKPVFLNFWATWCPPCRAEMPDLQKMYEKYASKMHFVAVNARESKGTIAEFLKANGYSFPVLLDSSGSVLNTYRVTGIPTSFVLDSQGIIRGKQVGMLQASQMEALIRQVLK